MEQLKVLGLRVHAEGRNTETLKTLEISTHQTIRLIKRIANRRYGMREANLVRLVQAFVISRIVYVAPCLTFGTAEKKKLEALIRRAYKQAIIMTLTTPTDKLLELGIHNTLDELIEAHTISQYNRLTLSPTGRHILSKLHIHYEEQHGTKKDIPKQIRKDLRVPPIPKNMHPEHHRERREARARYVEHKYQAVEDMVYVDTAEYRNQVGMSVVVVDTEREPLVSGTVTTNNPPLLYSRGGSDRIGNCIDKIKIHYQ